MLGGLCLLISVPLFPCLFRVNFSHLAKRLLQVFQEECVQKYQTSLVTHGNRMRLVHQARNHLRLVGCSVAACNTEAQGVQEGLSKVRFLGHLGC